METVTMTNFLPSASVVVMERCQNFGAKTAKNKRKSLKSSSPCSKFCCICGADVSYKMDPTMTTAQFGTFVRNILIPSSSSQVPCSSQLTKSFYQSKYICTICLDSMEQVEYLRKEMAKLEKALKQVVALLRLKMSKHSSRKSAEVDDQLGPIIFSGGPILPEDKIKEEEEDLGMDVDEAEEDVKPIIVEEMEDDQDFNDEPDSPQLQDAIDELDGEDQPRNIPASFEEQIPPTLDMIAHVEESPAVSEPISIPPDDMEVHDNDPEPDNNTTPHVPEESSSSSSPLRRSTRQSKLLAQQMIRSLNKKDNDQSEDDNVSSSNEDDEDNDSSGSSTKSLKSSSSDSESDDDSDKSDTEDGDDFPCNVCGNVYQTRRYLNDHRRNVHKITVQRKYIPKIIGPRFHCSICDRGYLTRKEMQKHCRKIHKITTPRIKIMESGQWDCEICGEKFDTRKAVEMHRRQVHRRVKGRKSNAAFVCDICQREFTTLSSLILHKKKHNERIIGPLFHCSICDNGFARLKTLNYHIKRFHTITEPKSRILQQGPFNCEVCQRDFTTLNGLSNHKRTRHNATPKTAPGPKLPCNICKTYLSNRHALYQHKLRVHDKVHSFLCQECGWKFMSSHKLKAHIARHHFLGAGPPPRKRIRRENHHCDICNVGYTLKRGLQQHMKRAHGPEKTLKCGHPGCKKAFYSQLRFDEHVKHYHPEEGSQMDPKICEICGETFSNVHEKIYHMSRTHPGKFCCSLCNGLEFTSKINLRVHMKRHKDRDEKPYLCSNCGRRFGSKGYKAHMATVCNPNEEAKERNRKRKAEEMVKYRAKIKKASIKCRVCGKGFLGQRKLDFHIAKFHKDQEAEGGESGAE